MSIEPINHFSLSSHPSIYDEEAMTALELAGRTAGKTNECVEAVNVLEINTTARLSSQDTEINSAMLSHDAAVLAVNQASAAAIASANQAQEAATQAEQAIQEDTNVVSGYKQDSEAWAAGTKNGVAVDIVDVQHQNNAKYYSEQAALSGSRPVINVLKFNGVTPETAANTAVLTTLISDEYSRQFVRLHVYDWDTGHTAFEVKYVLTPYAYKSTGTAVFCYFYNSSTLSRYTISLINGTYTQTEVSTIKFITPTMIGTWIEDPGYTVGFLKDASGVVRLKGRVRGGGGGSPAFILPSGFLPLNTNAYFPVVSNGLLSYVTIAPSGSVLIPATASSTYVTLDGISFIAEN